MSEDTLALPDDITPNNKHLKNVEIDTAVINNDFIVEVGIKSSKVIFIEPKEANAKQGYNLILAKQDWKKAKLVTLSKKIMTLSESLFF